MTGYDYQHDYQLMSYDPALEARARLDEVIQAFHERGVPVPAVVAAEAARLPAATYVSNVTANRLARQANDRAFADLCAARTACRARLRARMRGYGSYAERHIPTAGTIRRFKPDITDAEIRDIAGGYLIDALIDILGAEIAGAALDPAPYGALDEALALIRMTS